MMKASQPEKGVVRTWNPARGKGVSETKCDVANHKVICRSPCFRLPRPIRQSQNARGCNRLEENICYVGNVKGSQGTATCTSFTGNHQSNRLVEIVASPIELKDKVVADNL